MNILRHLLKLGSAIALAGLFAAQGLATETGEPANGKSPSECVMHLKRLIPVPDQPWRHQLFQNAISLTPGGDYTLTFWARGSTTFKFGVSTKMSAPPWKFFGLRDDVLLTPEWRRYTFHFNATGAEPGQTRLTFNFVTPEAAEVWIGDVELKAAGASGESSENLVANAQFSDGLMHWFIEGKQPGVFEAEMQLLSDIDASGKK